MKDIIYSKIKKGLYAIEEDGRVWSKTSSRYMKTSIDKDGYSTISLKNDRNGYSHFGIHRLLMIAFSPVEDMENLQVNHIDGDKTNNNLNNLEWCTTQYNLKHAREHRLNTTFGAKGMKHPNNKISEIEAKQIIWLYGHNFSPKEILQKIPNATKNIINSVVHNRTWKHLNRDEIMCSTTIPLGSTSQAIGDGKE